MTFFAATVDISISSNFGFLSFEQHASGHYRDQRALATIFLVFGPASGCATPPVPGQPTSCTIAAASQTHRFLPMPNVRELFFFAPFHAPAPRPSFPALEPQ
jgi:hypothetical protein